MIDSFSRVRYPQVIDRTDITKNTYLLRFERASVAFEPGQYLMIGLPDRRDMREYSIFSAPADPFLEILVKEIASGRVSPALRRLSIGEHVAVDGPFGDFGASLPPRNGEPALFVATGTGISPFHSLARAHRAAEYQLLHGVRHNHERYFHDRFPPERIIGCVTRSTAGKFPGRVTDYLRAHPVAATTDCYLCGNSDMIYEVYGVLSCSGVPARNIFAEIYF